jgi:beta-glucosidase
MRAPAAVAPAAAVAAAGVVMFTVMGSGCLRAPAPGPVPPPDAPYRDPRRPVDERVADLVGRMTLAEKVGQMVNAAPAIPRLGVPAYDWWSEGLHGVGRAGLATVFPQAIGLAASWDEALMRQVATAISDEARAKHHEAARRGDRGRYQGLTFFSPNVNLFRDPRWGRGQETYGEDPFLTGRLGVAFIKGMQGDDPRYLKLVATAKHFAVHSGPEALRHGFDARVSEHDLRDSYLPQFEACVREGRVGSVMPAYNRVDGQPCAASPRLLRDILRGEWGFSGYVVSDCGAVDDIYGAHRFAASAREAAALALRAGTDVSCGGTFQALQAAAGAGLVGQADIDRAVRRLFAARFALGMFDPPETVPYARIPLSVVDSPAHRALAKVAAQKSMVLLENRGDLLPLGAGARTVAVVGPTADDHDVLLGNYFGKPSHAVTILDGIRDKARGRGVAVTYERGVGVVGGSTLGIRDAVDAARRADVVVAVLGQSPRYEGEENESADNPGGDRQDLALPGLQERLLEALAATGKPVVLVLTGGGALAIGWAKEHIPAILMAFYPGEEGGTAVADVLFGDAAPAGRLPVTFYRSVADLPPFADYAMAGRTYRYFTGDPVYAFGFGRSFTTFRYAALQLAPASARAGAAMAVRVSVDVTNSGSRAGDEVVQLYIAAAGAAAATAPAPAPIRWLAGFQRITLAPGERRTVGFTLDARALSIVDGAGRRLVRPGGFTVAVGGGQPARGGRYAGDGDGVTGRLEITGGEVRLPP